MKKALTVGINYKGTGTALKGCINDSNNVAKMLTDKGFIVEQILEEKATTAGIIAGLETLVKGTKPGDVIVFHYSGHGSQFPSKVEDDGFEEIICPIDLNWRDKVITDDTLRKIFDTVPNGVNVTLFLDCCHSGTMLDQIESTVTKDRAVPSKKTAAKKKGSRYMKPPVSVLKKLNDRDMVEWAAARDVNATAMLIASSRSDQTAADTIIDGVAQGAGTASLLKAVSENPKITYKELIDSMHQYMLDNRYTQRPVLDGSFGLHNETFLDPWSMFIMPPDLPELTDDQVALVLENNPPPVVDVPEEEKTDRKPLVFAIIGVLLLVAFVLFL